MEQKREEGCFISGAAEAQGAEVNVDFLHMMRAAESSCGYLMY